LLRSLGGYRLEKLARIQDNRFLGDLREEEGFNRRLNEKKQNSPRGKRKRNERGGRSRASNNKAAFVCHRRKLWRANNAQTVMAFAEQLPKPARSNRDQGPGTRDQEP